MAKRIQRKRTKGWRMPENTISVTRPGKWGNPFKVGTYLNAWGKAFIAIKLTDKPEEIHKIYQSGLFDDKITLEKSLQWYEMWLKWMIAEKKLDISRLKGANLSCWCKLTEKCHADILLKLASE